MATQDTTDETAAEETSEEVETTEETQSEDESSEDESKADEADDTEGTEEESEDEDKSDEDSEEEESDFTKAFSNIKGDTPEEYIPNLEEAYRQSSREAKRLSGEHKELQGRLDSIAAAVASNPELAKAINDATGEDSVPATVDPALLKARTDMRETMEKEYNEFMDAHPELEDDETLSEELMETLAELGAVSRSKGKILGMGEGLKKAWALVGPDDSDEKLRSKAKDTASKSKTPNNAKKRKPEKPTFTEDQIAVAKKMGLTPEQLAAANKPAS